MVDRHPEGASGRKRPFQKAAGVLGALQRFWRTLLADLEAIRGAPIIAVLQIVCAVLMFTDQGADLAVSAGSDTCKAAWMVLATAFYGLQCWFWVRFIVEQRLDRGPDEFARRPRLGKVIRALREWTPRLLGGAPFLIAGVATWKADVDIWQLPGIFLVLGGVAVFLLWARRGAAASFLLFDGALFNRLFQRGALVLGAGSIIVLCAWPVGPAQFLGAISVFFLGLAFITAALASLLNASRVWSLPVLSGLVVYALVCGLLNDNHVIGRRTFWRQTEMDRAMAPSKPATASDKADERRPKIVKLTLEQRFEAWCEAQGPKACDNAKGDPLPIVFVAAEGGASRAGYWAADVLGKLQYETRGSTRFSDKVFAISSISGGSVGAVAYVSTLADTPDLEAPAFADGLVDVAGVDYLSPAMGGMLFPDLAQRFLPWPALPDRAETLETGFESGWRQHCRHANDNDPDHVDCRRPDLWAKPFLSLWTPAPTPGRGGTTRPWLPIVMINGARQEDGRRVITSDIEITPEDFPNAIDFHRLTDRDVRISTAILNGARFPLISPGGTLVDGNGIRQGHLLDGGYFDGGGVASMADIAAATLRIANSRGTRLKPVFIELNNDSDRDDTAADLIRAGATDVCGNPQDQKDRDACTAIREALYASKSHGYLADLLGPLEGLYAARGAHGTAAAMSLAQTVLNHGGAAESGSKAAPGKQAAVSVESVAAVGETADEEAAPPEWGASPTYRLVHLCKTENGVPMDWALSRSAMQHADEALGIGARPGRGEPAIPEDPRMKAAACPAQVQLGRILADVGVEPVGGQTRHVLRRLDDGGLWRMLWIALAVTVGGVLMISWADWRLQKLKTPATVSLQRRGTVRIVDQTIRSWRETPKAMGYVWTAFGFDLLLIVGYTATIIVLALLLIHHQPRHDLGPPVHGYLTGMFGGACILAGLTAIADLAEDGLEIRMIRKGASEGVARAASLATRAKWILLAASVIVLLVGAVLGCERGG